MFFVGWTILCHQGFDFCGDIWETAGAAIRLEGVIHVGKQEPGVFLALFFCLAQNTHNQHCSGDVESLNHLGCKRPLRSLGPTVMIQVHSLPAFCRPETSVLAVYTTILMREVSRKEGCWKELPAGGGGVEVTYFAVVCFMLVTVVLRGSDTVWISQVV